MTRTLAILAALALVIFTGSHVFSLPMQRSDAAYEKRFGFSPNDDDGYDAELDKVKREAIRYAKDRRAKWYSLHVIVEPGE